MLRRLLSMTLAAALGVTLAPSAAAQGVPVGEATDAQKATASDKYVAGKEAFDQEDYQTALEEFRASYDVVASPNTRLMIVASLTELGRHVEAYREVGEAITHAEEAAALDPKYEATVETLREAKSDLSGEIGRVTVQVPPAAGPGAQLTIDGQTVASDRWGEPIAVEPGSHTVELTGHETERIDVMAGDEATVHMVAATPEPSTPEPSEAGGTDESVGDWFIDNRRPIAYAAGGVGAAGMIVFGVLGGLTLSTQSDLDDVCLPDKRCPAASADDIDRGKSYQAGANAGLIIGIVGLAAGGGLLAWDMLDDDSASEKGDEGDPTALNRLRLRAGAGYLGVEGSF